MYDLIERSNGLPTALLPARKVRARDTGRPAKSRSRRRGLRLEWLEDRTMLDGNVAIEYHFDHVIGDSSSGAQFASTLAADGIAPFYTSSPSGYTPAQIRAAYGIDSIMFGSLVGDGAGQTIAIVDAYDDPALVSSTNPNFNNSDLHKFDLQFGLPDPPSFSETQPDRRHQLACRIGIVRLVDGGSPGRGVGPRHRSQGEHHPFRGQQRFQRSVHGDQHRPELYRRVGGLDELGIWRILRRDLLRQLFHDPQRPWRGNVCGINGR